MDPETIIAVVVGALGSVATWWLARRRQSGKIGTSDADDLWKAEGDFRRDLQKVIDNLRSRMNHLEDEKAACMEKLSALEGEVRYLKTRLGDKPTSASTSGC